MVFQIVSGLEKSGELRQLAKARIINSTVFHYFEIYLDFDKNVKTGMKIMDASFETAAKMKVSELTVRRARKMMTTK